MLSAPKVVPITVTELRALQEHFIEALGSLDIMNEYISQLPDGGKRFLFWLEEQEINTDIEIVWNLDNYINTAKEVWARESN